MRRFKLAPGVLIEPVGDQWAAYSALSGDSHLLNDESVTILTALDDGQVMTQAAICSAVAGEWSIPGSEVESQAAQAWDRLVESGLIIDCTETATLSA